MDLIARHAGRALAMVLCLRALAGCGPAVQRSSHDTVLDGGFVEIHVQTPQTSAPPYPVVISFLGEHEPFLRAGFAVATFQMHWERLRGLAAPASDPLPSKPAAPANGPVGVWLLASPSPRTVGQRYFGLIAAEVAAVRKVVDHLTTLDVLDASRIGIAGSSTKGFVSLEATIIAFSSAQASRCTGRRSTSIPRTRADFTHASPQPIPSASRMLPS